jgi:hypothetical protein
MATWKLAHLRKKGRRNIQVSGGTDRLTILYADEDVVQADSEALCDALWRQATCLQEDVGALSRSDSALARARARRWLLLLLMLQLPSSQYADVVVWHSRRVS